MGKKYKEVNTFYLLKVLNPPTDWDSNRRLDYFEWAEKVINNCPRVNESLENHFAEVVRKGKNLINEK